MRRLAVGRDNWKLLVELDQEKVEKIFALQNEIARLREAIRELTKDRNNWVRDYSARTNELGVRITSLKKEKAILVKAFREDSARTAVTMRAVTKRAEDAEFNYDALIKQMADLLNVPHDAQAILNGISDLAAKARAQAYEKAADMFRAMVLGKKSYTPGLEVALRNLAKGALET